VPEGDWPAVLDSPQPGKAVSDLACEGRRFLSRTSASHPANGCRPIFNKSLSVGLAPQLRLQLAQCRTKPGHQRFEGAQMDGRRYHVVAGLSAVHMVVGVNRLVTAFAPSSSAARLAMTSFAFMFVEVPDPVWKMSATNWSSSRPSATSCAAFWIAPAIRPEAVAGFRW